MTLILHILQELSSYDIHDEYEFYLVLCAGQGLNIWLGKPPRMHR